jgi:hypothetical protein
MLWYLATHHVTAIDCLGDSIVADVTDTLSVADACASPGERKIFAACGGRPFSIIDMDNPAHVETLFTVHADGGQLVSYVPNAHKVLWASMYNDPYPGKTFFRVIDSRTSIISDSFWVGRQVSGMCLDHTGNYVYCTGYEDSVMFIIDTRTDSAVASVRLPSLPAGPPVLNSRTSRIYAAQYQVSNNIPVVRDSMLIGLEELESAGPTPRTDPTMLRRGVPLSSEAAADLYDAFGRVAAVLRPGLNDISRLAQGVYFAREQAAVANQHSGAAAARKLVIAR